MLPPLLTGVGLSASAGLNAYIPLLVIALVDHMRDGRLLGNPYEFLASLTAIGVLLVLLTIELIADKSPWYRANDLIQSMIRPAAGALAFMAATSNTAFNPVVALILGLVVAAVIHATKAAFRRRFALPIRNVILPAVSIGEDAYAAVLSSFALAVPVAGVFLILPLAGVALWTVSRKPVPDEPVHQDTPVNATG